MKTKLLFWGCRRGLLALAGMLLLLACGQVPLSSEAPAPGQSGNESANVERRVLKDSSCSAGYYLSGTTCTQCAAGTYSTGGTVTACTSCTAAAGYYCAVGSTQAAGTTCPAGYYCAGGSANKTACAAGTFNPSSGSSAVTACQKCSAGTYCGSNAQVSSDVCVACVAAAGHYCPEGTGSSTGASCPVGKYCTGGTAQPADCTVAAGYYCPINSTTAAGVGCPVGYFSTATGAVTTCTACTAAAGYYCPSGSAAAAGVICPAYKYCTGTTNAPVTCMTAHGSYCPAGSSTNAGTTCPAGYYCEGDDHGSTPCPQGTYNASVGAPDATYCVKCGIGTYNDKTAQSSLQACLTCAAAAGSYCPTGSTATTGSSCPAGSSCAGGSANAVACAAGSYAAGGTSTCTACTAAAGKYCPAGFNSAAGTNCPAGQYCTGGATLPINCAVAAGNYCPAGSSTASGVNCPAGTYSGATGAVASCANCTATGGYYCPAGFTSPAGQLCPTGLFCDGGTAQPSSSSTTASGYCDQSHYGNCPKYPSGNGTLVGCQTANGRCMASFAVTPGPFSCTNCVACNGPYGTGYCTDCNAGFYGLTCQSTDNVVPTIAVSSPAAGSGNWYKPETVVTIQFADAGSGLKNCALKLNSNLSMASSGSNGDFSVDTACSGASATKTIQLTNAVAGGNTVYAGAYDVAKIYGSTSLTYFVDRNPPTIDTSSSASLLNGTTPAFYDTWPSAMAAECAEAGIPSGQCFYGYSTYAPRVAGIQIYGKDTESGLGSYYLGWDSKPAMGNLPSGCNPGDQTCSFLATIPNQASATLYFGVGDRVTYTATQQWTLAIDNRHPLLSYNAAQSTCTNAANAKLDLSDPSAFKVAQGACVIVLDAKDVGTGFPAAGGKGWAVKWKEVTDGSLCGDVETNGHSGYLSTTSADNPLVGGNPAECTDAKTCQFRLAVQPTDTQGRSYCIRVIDVAGHESNLFRVPVKTDNGGPVLRAGSPCLAKYSFVDQATGGTTYTAEHCWYANPIAPITVMAEDSLFAAMSCQFDSLPSSSTNPAANQTYVLGAPTTSSGRVLYCRATDAAGWVSTLPVNPALPAESDRYYADAAGPVFSTFTGAGLLNYWTSSSAVTLSAAYTATLNSPATRWVYYYQKVPEAYSGNPASWNVACPTSGSGNTTPPPNGTSGYTRVDLDNSQIAQSTRQFTSPELSEGCTKFCLIARNSVQAADEALAWSATPIATYVCRDATRPSTTGTPYVQNGTSVAASTPGTRYITKDQATLLPTWIWSGSTDYYVSTTDGSGIVKYLVTLTSPAGAGIAPPTVTDNAVCSLSSSATLHTVTCNIPLTYGAGIATCDAANRCAYPLPVRLAWNQNPNPITTPPSADYTYTVSVVAVDKVGMRSLNSGGQDLNVDISPPSAGAVSAPALASAGKCPASTPGVCYTSASDGAVAMTVSATDGFVTANAPQSRGLRAIFSKNKLFPDGNGRLEAACLAMKTTSGGAAPSDDATIDTTPLVDLSAAATLASAWYRLENSAGTAVARNFSVITAKGSTTYYVYLQDGGGNCTLAALPGANGLTIIYDDAVPAPVMSLWASDVTAGSCSDAGSSFTSSTSVNVAMCTNDVSPKDSYFLSNNWIHNFDFQTTLWTESDETTAAPHSYYWGQKDLTSGRASRVFDVSSVSYVMELRPGSVATAEPALLYQRFAGGDQAIDGLTSGPNSIYTLAYDASVQYKIQDATQPSPLPTTSTRWKLVFDYRCGKAIGGNGYSFKVANDGGSDVLCGSAGTPCPGSVPSLRNFTCGASGPWSTLETDFFDWGSGTIPANPVFMAGINAGMNGDPDAKLYLRNVQLYRHPAPSDAVWTPFVPNDASFQTGVLNWTLSGGDGKKRVYLRVKDLFDRTSAENYGTITQRDIILDRRGPQFKADDLSKPKSNSFVVAGDVLSDPTLTAPWATFINTPTPAVTLLARDNWYPITAAFSKDLTSLPASPAWLPLSTASLPSAVIPTAETDGRKELRVWYKDGGGNLSGPAYAAVVLDRTPPTLSATLESTSPTSDTSVHFSLRLDDSWTFASIRDVNGYPSSGATYSLKYCVRVQEGSAPAPICPTASDSCWTSLTPGVTHSGLSVSVSALDGTKTLHLFAMDGGGNMTTSATKLSLVFDGGSITCSDSPQPFVIKGYDLTATTPNSEYTATRFVDLQLNPLAAENYTAYKIANTDGTFSAEFPLSYDTPTPTWCAAGQSSCRLHSHFEMNVSTGYGLKTLRLHFKNASGVWSNPCQASIVYDNHAPDRNAATGRQPGADYGSPPVLQGESRRQLPRLPMDALRLALSPLRNDGRLAQQLPARR